MEKAKQLGLYLIPPYGLAKEVLTMRNLVFDQYRVAAAQNFMIHMTLIGFFRLTDGSGQEALISALDGYLSGQQALRIYPQRVAALDNGLGVVFPPERNRELYRLQSSCFDAARPYIAHDSRMPRTGEADEEFEAHVTVSMVDASRKTLTEMEEYFSDVRFAQEGYLTRVVKLYEFTSDLWEVPDTWIYAMGWRSLHCWQLGDSYSRLPDG